MKGRERRGWASPQISLNLIFHCVFEPNTISKESVFPTKAAQAGFFQHRRNTLSSHSMATANFGEPAKLAAL